MLVVLFASAESRLAVALAVVEGDTAGDDPPAA